MGTLNLRASRPLRPGLVLVVLALLVAGCDLFKPATPQVGGVGSTLLPSYVEPESCLVYMQVGIELKEKSGGRDAYLGALADTTKDSRGFHAFFDLAVWNAYADTRPADWDWSFEGEFLSRFIQAYPDPYRMEWLEDPDYPIANEERGDQSRILRRRYQVWARRSTSDSLLIAVGYAKLTFVHFDSPARWALALWEDRVDPEAGFPPADPDQQCFGHRRLDTR